MVYNEIIFLMLKLYKLLTYLWMYNVKHLFVENGYFGTEAIKQFCLQQRFDYVFSFLQAERNDCLRHGH